MRKSEYSRKTAETDISLALNIDGTGEYKINTSCGFFDHMMELFARHGLFDITLSCVGDIGVDYHHTVEDVGIALGRAFSDALGDRAGIRRFGDCAVPMDEVLVLAAADISGRPTLGFDVSFNSGKIGDFDVELVEEFLLAFSRALGATIHIRQLAGSNGHHIAEGIFKALARALREALEQDSRTAGIIPSTKGTIL